MASPGVESQRLISLSLGKIAASRCQKGGINLHKNLLVATVLHKARTACMVEFHNMQRQRQLELQQRQQAMQRDAATLEFEQKQEQARSAALSLAAFNTEESASSQEEKSNVSSNGPIPTCVREMDEEIQAESEVMTPSQVVSAACSAPLESDLGQSLPAPVAALVPASITELGQRATHFSPAAVSAGQVSDKENSPPSLEDSDDEVFAASTDLEDDSDIGAAQVVPQSCVTTDHLILATKLAEDAAQASSPSVPSSRTSALPTCNILKRQRDNSGPASASSNDQDLPAPVTKRARLVRQPSIKTITFISPTPSSQDNCAAAAAASSELTPSSHHQPQHTPSAASSDSHISNLVNIFNSGFTGLCPPAPAQATPVDYCTSLESDACGASSAVQYHTLSSPSQQSSLSCSSSLGRLDSLPMGLVLSV